MLELLCLSTELLEQVFLAQTDIKDIISLAFSCSRLHKILSQPRMWRNILGKVMRDNNSTITVNLRFEVEILMKFKNTIEEPYKSMNTMILHDTICEMYPGSQAMESETREGEEEEGRVRMEDKTADARSSVMVICSLSPQPHQVSVPGLQLLSLTEGESSSHIVQVIKLGQPAFFQDTLCCLGSSRPRLEVEGTVYCRTEEEGRQLADLLERCSSWRVGVLVLGPGVGGGTWQGLAREAGRGRLEGVRTGKKVVGRGNLEEVRELWEKTEGIWVVGGEVQGGWQSIQNIHRTRLSECCSNNHFLLFGWQIAVSIFILCLNRLLQYVGWEMLNTVLWCIFYYHFQFLTCVQFVHLVLELSCLKRHRVSCYLTPQCHSAYCLALVRLLG